LQRRAQGLYVSWQSASQQVVVMVAALIGLSLDRWLTAQQMANWGWRVPLWIGCLVISCAVEAANLAGGDR